MPIATNLDMNKDLNLCTPRPTYPVLVEFPQLRKGRMPLEGLFWADGTDRYATCGPLPGCGHRRWSASGSRVGLFSPFRRLHGPRGVVGESAASSWPRQRCIRPTVSLAGLGRLKGAHVTAGGVAFSAVFPDHLQGIGPSTPRSSCGRRVR